MYTRLKAASCLVGGLAVFPGLTACTSAPPAPVAGTPAAPPSTASRPVDLPLQGVDPCALLSEQQLDELKVSEQPEALAPDLVRDGPTCSLPVNLGQPHYTYYIEAIGDADVENWVSGERHKAGKVTEPIQVEGYPALRHFGRVSEPSDCETLVGVARGQTLRVQVYPLTRGVFSQDQLCEMTAEVAADAVRTLQAKG